MKIQLILSILLLGFVTAVIMVYWQVWAGQGFVWRYYQEMDSDPPMKTILLWTKWWAQWHTAELADSWGIVQFNNWTNKQYLDLRDFGCDEESYRCAITSDRSYLPDHSMYDGILFHQFDTSMGDLPDKEKRQENQNYIFYTMETPKDGQIPTMPDNFFNVTMSYHNMSQIFTPYGKMVQTRDHPMGAKLQKYIADFGKQNARNVTGRNFSATLLMSSCTSWNERDRLLADLRKMMPVDVYGGCGKPVPTGKDVGNTQHTDDSHKFLGQTYPFYLAFENSLCEDYVTEKFFSSLNSNMIPVVYNGANMSGIAPPHSYIDVKDFKSVKELGSYLQKVHSDPVLYSSYFWWRDFYRVEYIGRHFFKSFTKIFCEACRYLHTVGEPQVVKSLNSDWVDGRCMKLPVISYLGLEEDEGEEEEF